MDWGAIWNQIKSFFINNVWNIVLFVAVLFFGIIFIKLILNILKKAFSKTKMEKITQSFIAGICKVCLYLILVLSLLSIIGIQITGIITALSALLLAVGMALQNNIANVANGIVIVSSHLFKKGDYISCSGFEGSVLDINFLFTTLKTPDNKKVIIPNSTIVNSGIVNNGSNHLRRVDFTFSVAYESDLELVKKTVIDVMKSDGRVYLDPEPFCKLKVMNASSLDFFANCWCDAEDYWDVYYYVTENVYNEFKRNNISVPYNQLEVRERKDAVNPPVVGAALPERVEKVRVQAKKHFDIENGDLTKLFKKEKKEKKAKKNKKGSDTENIVKPE